MLARFGMIVLHWVCSMWTMIQQDGSITHGFALVVVVVLGAPLLENFTYDTPGPSYVYLD